LFEPASVRRRPCASLIDAAVQQQQLRNALAAAHQIAAHLLADAREVRGCLERGLRHGDRLQLPGEQQPREQLRVLPITLDPIGRSARRLRRRHDLQPQPSRLGRR
jgi:hypothetical protein